MFAFFGLGVQEILVLAILGGGIVFVVFFVLALSKRSSAQSPDRVAELEEENRRLRAQVNERRETDQS